MAKSEPVEVAVEIVDEFSKDLKELEGKLEKIDGKRLTVELDIDDDGDIKEIKGKLKELERKLETTLDVDVRAEEAFAQREALERDMRSKLHVDVDRDRLGSLGTNVASTDGGLPAGPPGVSQDVIENIRAIEGSADHRPHSIESDSSALSAVNRLINEDVARAHNRGIPKSKRDGWIGPSNWAFGIGEDMGRPRSRGGPKWDPGDEFMASIERATRRAMGAHGGKGGIPATAQAPYGGARSLFETQRQRRNRNMLSNLGRNVKGRLGSAIGTPPTLDEIAAFQAPFESDSGDSFIKKIGVGIQKYKPNIMMMWNFLAALIPILVTLLGAAIGLAAAFGTLAVAGGAVVGLGLLGWGDNTAEAMKNAKLRLMELKNELFDAIKPVSKAFAPISDQLLGNLPGAVSNLAGSLRGLAGFESFIGRAGGGVMSWLGDAIDRMVALRAEMEQLGMRFGSIFGTLITDLLEWSVKALSENQDAIIRLGSILGSLAVIIYNLSAAFSMSISVLAPLFKILAGLSGLLNNAFVVGLGTAIVAILAMQAALAGLNFLLGLTMKGMFGVALNGVKALVMGMYSLIATTLSAIGVVGALNAVLATLLTMTGVGAALVIGGLAAGQMMENRSAGADYSGYSGGGGGGGGSTINIYGDVGNTEYQKMKDNFGSMYDERAESNAATEK